MSTEAKAAVYAATQSLFAEETAESEDAKIKGILAALLDRFGYGPIVSTLAEVCVETTERDAIQAKELWERRGEKLLRLALEEHKP